MYVVMGATGHIGSAVLNTLLEHREPVVALTHDTKKQPALERRGAQVAVADVCDVEALRSVFERCVTPRRRNVVCMSKVRSVTRRTMWPRRSPRRSVEK